MVFVVDDPERVGQAYWGGYGAAQHGRIGLMRTLHAELAGGPVRVSALQPGPMRTALRALAYVEEDDVLARDPAPYAGACVRLLSLAGKAHRGTVWAPAIGGTVELPTLPSRAG